MKETDVVTARRRTFLLIIALLSIYFLVASIYAMPLIEGMPRPQDTLVMLPVALLILPVLFSPLFAGYGWFFGLLALALLLVVLALVWAWPSRLIRLCLLAGIPLLLAAPLLLPLLYGPYTLPVEAEAGYEMFWLTEPQQPFASAFKEAQRVHDKYGCDYFLLGWTEDEVLYYRSACDGRVWAFDPAAGGPPRRVSGGLSMLAQTRVEGVTPPFTIDPYPSHPVGFPPTAKNHAITYQKAVSPQGNWVAAAIKNYYGPRDVVVLSR